MSLDHIQQQEQAKILLVDDSQTCRASLTAKLLTMGLIVVEADCAMQALAMMQQEKPDWVLADMMMPDLTGYQLCALIKEHPEFAHTPVLVMSAEDSPLAQAQAEMAGAEHYLVKPFELEQIEAVFAEHNSTHNVPKE